MSDRKGRGGGSGNAANSKGGQSEEKPKRGSIIDLSKYIDVKVRVKFSGGREVVGTLKGHDQLFNLVMDDVEELVRDPETLQPVEPEKKRNLGLVVLRGPAIVVISPEDGYEEIANPFASAEE